MVKTTTPRVGRLIERVHEHLMSLPGVHTNHAWGGRIYKVGRLGRDDERNVRRRSGKLLAYCAVDKDKMRLYVDFKLAPDVAKGARKASFISRHSFKTLARANWVTAELSRLPDARKTLKWLDATYAMLRV